MHSKMNVAYTYYIYFFYNFTRLSCYLRNCPELHIKKQHVSKTSYI